MNEEALNDGVLKGYMVKLKNRRVWLGQLKDGRFRVEFKRLGSKADGEDKTVVLGFNLSPEAMRALVMIYTDSFMKM